MDDSAVVASLSPADVAKLFNLKPAARADFLAKIEAERAPKPVVVERRIIIEPRPTIVAAPRPAVILPPKPVVAAAPRPAVVSPLVAELPKKTPRLAVAVIPDHRIILSHSRVSFVWPIFGALLAALVFVCQ